MSQNYLDRDRLTGYGKQGLRFGLNTLSGFQKFIIRGNVVDLAVGIVIGAAFTTLVSAFVSDIIQPLLAKFLNNVDTFDKFTPGGFKIGALVGAVITFLITAAVVYFFVVRPITALRDQYDRLHHKDVAPTTRDCPFCLSSVPLKATRCAYCTAQLPPIDNQPAQNIRPAGPRMS